ncbi:MAG TPA: amidase family protein [Candidatus Sulfotelmatobacter sp.]|nr:amidase family protein [Candidatus Sulfotelmatobacter sp.]
MSELWRLSATEAVARLKRRELQPIELIDAALARIAAVDKPVNALPTLCAERARAAAKRLDGKTSDDPGWLAGLPIAIKDTAAVAGVRTTYGSPIYANHVPTQSDIQVEILESRGAVVLAKSNTPEFAAGANTFNEVFGKTRNPWRTTQTAGGSSGGSAAALATGQVWLAHGSDTGGSLRIPASFCGVVGLRPSPGRVAHRAGRTLPFEPISVDGPMARTVGDLALFLDAMTGEHWADPVSLPRPAAPFQRAVAQATLPARIAWSPDLGGRMPLDAEVRAGCADVVRRLERPGVAVEQACPELGDPIETFRVIRAVSFAARYADLLRTNRKDLKPEIIGNIEAGLKLTGEEVGRAEGARRAMVYGAAEFFRRFDVLVTPAVIVPPFDIEQRYVTEVGGFKFSDYVGWLVASFAITLTSCPAISIPCGFTKDGLPIGLQIVAPFRGEAALLSAAASIEAELGLANKAPIDPVVAH